MSDWRSNDAMPRRGRSGVGQKTRVQLIPWPNFEGMDKVLPCSVEAERLLLGSVLLDGSRLSELLALEPDDFSVENHRRIFDCLRNLQTLGQPIDRLTVFEQLKRCNLADSCGGISYLIALDDNMPNVIHLDAWVRIVVAKSRLRRLVFVGQKLMEEALLANAVTDEIVTQHAVTIQKLSQKYGAMAQRRIADIPPVRDVCSHDVEYLRAPELPRGAVIGSTGDSGSGKSTLALWLAGQAAAAGTPALILDRENPIASIKERLDRFSIKDGTRLLYLGNWLPEEVPQPDAQCVLEWAKASDPKPLIVVDSLIAFHGGDENDSGQMRALMQRSRRLADLGATALVIHHDGKANSAKDFRGSSDFKAAIDQGFHVSNSSSDRRLGSIRLRCYRSRFGFSGEIRYNYAGNGFTQAQEPTALARTNDEDLKELLRQSPGVSATEFERLAAGKNLGRNRARDFSTKDFARSVSDVRQVSTTRNAIMLLTLTGAEFRFAAVRQFAAL